MSVKLEDVARYARVSSATVSRVLAGKSNGRRGVKERVLAAVELLGYEPNRMAQNLRLQRSHLVGLVISDIQNPFFTSVVRAVEDALGRAGFAVLLFNSDDNAAKEDTYLHFLKVEKVAGVIVAPTQHAAQSASALLGARIPVVTIDRTLDLDVENLADLGVDSVTTDNRAASYELVKELENHHKRIAAILPSMSLTTGRERYEGYRQALRERGLSIFDEFVMTGRNIEEHGFESAKALLGLPEPPTAFFLGANLITLGALRYFFETGRTIPEDVAVVAFDKLGWLPNVPRIIHAEQSSYALGEEAVRLLLSRIDEPQRSVRSIVLPSVIRK